jgi:hypothetical protein
MEVGGPMSSGPPPVNVAVIALPLRFLNLNVQESLYPFGLLTSAAEKLPDAQVILNVCAGTSCLALSVAFKLIALAPLAAASPTAETSARSNAHRHEGPGVQKSPLSHLQPL